MVGFRLRISALLNTEVHNIYREVWAYGLIVRWFRLVQDLVLCWVFGLPMILGVEHITRF